jgi:hypothetical protein
MPGSFWESYCAMANTQGGTMVLGVAEKVSGLVWEGEGLLSVTREVSVDVDVILQHSRARQQSFFGCASTVGVH